MVVENQTSHPLLNRYIKVINHTYKLQVIGGDCVFKFTSLSRVIRFPLLASFDGNWQSIFWWAKWTDIAVVVSTRGEVGKIKIKPKPV